MRKKPIYRIPCKFCSKILNLKEWQIKRVKNNFCNGICTMRWRYNYDGLDGKLITAKAHQKVREFGQPKRKGKPASWISSANAKEIKAKISKVKTGVRIEALQGIKHWNWKGGVDKGIWFTWEYKQWRKSVFKRDNYTCVLCGDKKGSNLEADHIKPRYSFPELTFELDNGRTLCHNCHIETPTYGSGIIPSRE